MSELDITNNLDLNKFDATLLYGTVEIMLEVFKDDTILVDKWMKTENPNLGGVTPLQMFKFGNAKEVYWLARNIRGTV